MHGQLPTGSDKGLLPLRIVRDEAQAGLRLLSSRGTLRAWSPRARMMDDGALAVARDSSGVEPDGEGSSERDTLLARELIAQAFADERKGHCACDAEEHNRVLPDRFDSEVFTNE